MDFSQTLKSLTEQMDALQRDALRMQDFLAFARSQNALLAALPEKYGAVFNDLLDRLESGALFSEESCSFSQRDLLDSLKLWCDKAQIQIT